MTSSFIRSVSCLGLQNSLKIYYRNLLTVPNLPEVTEVTSREVTEHHSHWLGDLQPWLHGDQRAIHLQLCHAGMARDLTNEMATAVLVAFKASSHQSAMRSTFANVGVHLHHLHSEPQSLTIFLTHSFLPCHEPHGSVLLTSRLQVSLRME
jgi:hypothetical protein